MTDWHLIHLGNLAQSGAALLTIEATAVMPGGRTTYSDVGLWSDACERAMARVLDGVRRWSQIPIAIQLSHAGRKASKEKTWLGGRQIHPSDPRGWQTVGPSPLPWAVGENAPVMLDQQSLAEIRDAFAAAAARAAGIGLDAIQIHAAHGYLLHQFLSPLSNCRTDEYGGSRDNRMRFPLEVFEAVRGAFPLDKPVTMRISATDWMDGGWDLEQTIELAHALKARGCAAIDVSSGGLHPGQKVPVGPSYQVPFAREVRREVGIPVAAVGMITAFDQAEAIVATGDADLVAIARSAVFNPRWPWHAAAYLGGRARAANQYLRSQPRAYPHLFDLG